MKKRLVLVACFWTVFTAYAIRYGYGILLPGMLVSLDISKVEAGAIYSSFFIAYTICSPILGLLGDRYDARWLISVFVVVLGLGAFFMSRTSGILQASIFYALAGIGSSACWAPVMALARRWTSAKSKGTTLAVIDIGSALGIIGTGSLAPVVVAASGWETGWMFLGIIGFAVAIFDFLVIRNRPSGDLNQQGLPPGTPFFARPPLGTLFKNSKFWLMGTAYLLIGFSILVPFTFLTTYATQELDLAYGVASSLLTVIGVGAILSKIFFGALSDRTGRIKIMMLCAALIACGGLGMVFAGGAALFIATGVFSLGYGVVWAMYASAASDYFPVELTGTTVGLWTVFLGIGSILSPVVAGWIADAAGTLSPVFTLTAAAGAVSFVLLVPVWRSGYPALNQAWRVK